MKTFSIVLRQARSSQEASGWSISLKLFCHAFREDVSGIVESVSRSCELVILNRCFNCGESFRSSGSVSDQL